VQLAPAGVRYFCKRKARTPFEFGVQVGLALTISGYLIVGAGPSAVRRSTGTRCTNRSSSIDAATSRSA
jgi:hypothetical protein